MIKLKINVKTQKIMTELYTCILGDPNETGDLICKSRARLVEYTRVTILMKKKNGTNMFSKKKTTFILTSILYAIKIIFNWFNILIKH
jgi:hypothetical protein